MSGERQTNLLLIEIVVIIIVATLSPLALALGLVIKFATRLGLGLGVRTVQQNLAEHVVSNLDTCPQVMIMVDMTMMFIALPIEIFSIHIHLIRYLSY